jgi:hypothetical protein
VELLDLLDVTLPKADGPELRWLRAHATMGYLGSAPFGKDRAAMLEEDIAAAVKGLDDDTQKWFLLDDRARAHERSGELEKALERVERRDEHRHDEDCVHP